MANVTTIGSTTTTSAPVALTLNASPPISARDEVTIAQSILRTLVADFARQGVPVNVEIGSDYYRLAYAIARQLAVNEANTVVSVDDFMPDSAALDALTRWMAIVGMAPRAAFGASGYVTITCSAPTPIAGSTTPGQGDQLVDDLNQVYQVIQGGTYSNGQPVPVQALSTGSSTEHVNGDTLTWIIAPPNCSPSVTVGTTGGEDGLSNGGDAEDVETARARFLRRLANPMGGGNAAQVCEVAEKAWAGVQAGFCYPAAGGPASYHVAVVGYATNLAASNARNRDIAAAILTGTITPYILGQLGEGSKIVVTTVANVQASIAIGLSLPAAPNAQPPGPGGGWLDAQPWPYNFNGAGSFKCNITSVTSTTQITCDAPSPPTAGVSRIAYLDPNTWKIFNATVISFTGSPGAYALTLSAPLVNVQSPGYIWPQCVNQQVYANAVLSAFASLGPGEKTASAGLLPRAFRKPLPSSSYPSSLGAAFLKALTSSGPEVSSAIWLYQSATTPALPGTVSDPPNIFVPYLIGFYPA
jgi:uncharacterized phage protein gp47/JayE